MTTLLLNLLDSPPDDPRTRAGHLRTGASYREHLPGSSV